MTFQEREQLVRRICNRRLYSSIEYKNEPLEVVFSDPNIELTAEADYIYNKSLADSKEMITLEESYEILKDRGDWSNSMAKELDKLQKDNKYLGGLLDGLKFQKKKLRITQEQMGKNKTRILQLESVKNQLWPTTAEYFSLKCKRSFLIKNIVKFRGEKDLSDLFKYEDLIDLLSHVYFEKNFISMAQIRELARTDPWRLYWITSKNGGKLFSHSISESNETEYALMLWSTIYDRAFESENRPSQEVIENDEAFDQWSESENKRNKSQNNDKGYNKLSGNEVFIPADEEGAKEVYAMNDALTRQKIQNREKVIKEKGSVIESELPDVKQRIMIEANNLAMNRSF